VERAIAFSRATRAPIYIVHLSSAAALDACRRARADGLPVYVETRPLYLYLTRAVFEQPDGAKYIGNPPLREAADTRAIWNGLRSGEIQCLCSDHAPWTLRQKLDPTLDITTVRPGVADLETLMPMLFSEGVRGGRVSLSRFVELTSTNASKLFGLYPRKGTIAVGSDADLVVWDPDARRTIQGATMRSKAGYSVYDGREVQGWPVYTVSRGEVVLEDGQVTATRGRGKWVRRDRPMAL
jgi:dihydropyrimidinase